MLGLRGSNRTKRSSNKRSLFGQRWSAETGFAKNVDRQDYRFDEVGNCSPATELHRQIIDRYKYKSSANVSNFVEKLRDDSMLFVAQQRGLKLSEMQRLSELNRSCAELVDHMFLFLCQCAIELNASLLYNDLRIVGTAPDFVSEVVRYNQARQPVETVTYYRARLASPTWSLVVRGKDDTIDFFVLSTGQLLGLSRIENGYKPAATLKAVIEDGQVSWEIDLKPFAHERQDELCMLLFKRLVDNSIAEVIISDDRQFEV